MAYSVIALENLTELKNRRGNSTSTTLATILGLNYPMVEAYSVYWWDNNSMTTPDDNECVQPILGGPSGRWFKIDLDQIPQVNSDWNAVSGITQILNKPDLSLYYLNSNPAGYITSVPAQSWASITGKPTTLSGYGIIDPVVLSSGSYSNPSWITSLAFSKLTGVPTIYSFTGTTAQYTRGDGTYATFPTAVSTFTNDSGYLTAITSGQITAALGYTPYNGITNPSGFLTNVTSSQVTSALGYTPVTSARTITINGTTQDLSANRTWTVGDVLTSGSYSNPAWITSLGWSKITGTPTTVAGYGITDAVTSSTLTTTLSGYATTSSLTSGLATKENAITAGTTSQYWRGDKSWQTLNTTVVAEGSNLYYTDARSRASISLTTTGSGAASYNTSTGVLNIPTPSNAKRIETYLGTTDASGNYTVTYATPFSTVPDVQPQLQSGTPSQVVRITSSTTTGFTVNVTNRASVTVLAVEVLLAATTPVSGASVGVLVTSR